jgi:Raf kinase inhibitor-like YbhB/YbcL family protein
MLSIRSTAFGAHEEIPKKYTCQGEDVSPALSFSGIPKGTKTLALIVDDPDAPDPAAPKRVWCHWIVFNLPPSSSTLVEGCKELPEGAQPGLNDWGRPSYGGPCPPIGRHRYLFKLHALDTKLELKQPKKADIEQAMQGHVLQAAELVGTYQKS